jgi:hypothetical protein
MLRPAGAHVRQRAMLTLKTTTTTKTTASAGRFVVRAGQPL